MMRTKELEKATYHLNQARISLEETNTIDDELRNDIKKCLQSLSKAFPHIFNEVIIESNKDIADTIHYLDCWDTNAYKTLSSALFELVGERSNCPTNERGDD